MASRWTFSAPASVIFPCIIKSRRWWVIMEEVNKGCSEFCVTVGTATRTAGILIHSRLKALAVNLSQPSSWLWLYAGLIGFNNPHWLKADLVVCAIASSSSSWVWVGECFFWYRLTQLVLNKGSFNSLCVCMLASKEHQLRMPYAKELWLGIFLICT